MNDPSRPPIVPLNDLKRQTDRLGAELAGAIERVLASGRYVLGPEVEAFEHEFATFCGSRHCVGVGSGTDALELALRALEIGPGDLVATVANAGGYATTAIRAIGAMPVFVDIDPDTLSMNPAALASALRPGVRAVVATHLYGQMANMPALLACADRAGVPVVEDCAQAHGAALEGRGAGSWGALGCFSFYPTKNLGSLGDGGAVVTSDPALAARVRRLRQYGWEIKYRVSLPGGRNSRLDELQAAILRVKLPHLPHWNARRRAIARAYTARFAPLGITLAFSTGEDYAAHLYVVRCANRDELRDSLAALGISTTVHYPIPDFEQEAWRDLGGRAGQLPVTEAAYREVVTLPCFPELLPHEVDRVADSVTVAISARDRKVAAK